MKKLHVILSLLLVFTMLLAACQTPAAEEPVDEEPMEEMADDEEVSEDTSEVEAPSTYQEAPMLAAMVEAGELPPVDERLPKNPFIVGPGVLIVEEDMPNWQSGEYGGELQMAHRGDFPPDVFIGSNEGYLAGAGIGVTGLQGNVFESFDVNDDARVFTFKLREGLRWSDGEPVTREDVEFAWNDVLTNTELYPGGVSGNWVSPITKNPATLEFVDDWTFTMTFDDPYGSLLVVMAIKGWVGYTDLVKPAHYLKEFHKDYADEAELLAKVEDAGYEGIEGWVNLFNQKDITNWEAHLEDAIGFPRLYPWLLSEMTEGALIYERNPYYYKVDVEGKQLPYIDRIVTARVDDVEMVNVRAIAGQVDFTRESPDVQALPVYREQEEAGNFTAYIFGNHVNPALIGFNFESKDEAFKEVANIKEFRQALNMAIDREEINQTIYFGLMTPSIATPSTPDVYDVDAANALLDEIGMTERDENGFRKTPSGKELKMDFYQAEYLAEHTTICELLIEYWAELGLNTTMEIISA
ncbi:MAG: ABC transporter substrate-binding protein, partial [Anaerolineae bacterium]|nr:ABC transporter substrate-binding protein [Anaerolineae bacterium]